jgi:hypothetical protein
MRPLRAFFLASAFIISIVCYGPFRSTGTERQTITEQKILTLQERMEHLDKLDIGARLAVIEVNQKTSKSILIGLLGGIIMLVLEAGLRLVKSGEIIEKK